MVLVVSIPSAFRNPRCWATQNGRLNSVRETLATLMTSAAGEGVGAIRIANPNNSTSLRFMFSLPDAIFDRWFNGDFSSQWYSAVAWLQRCLAIAFGLLTAGRERGMLGVCWFPGSRRGGKREHG